MNSTLHHQEAIAKAELSIRTRLETAADDHHRPMFHAIPSVNWMNDPNGLIYYNDSYQLYYQHNPYSEEWGAIHWAHMKSDNLLAWEHLPIALAPSESYDRDGCFSGSAIEHAGKLYLFYTANIFTSPQGLPDDLLQQQCLAVSNDGGITFEKYSGNPIVSAPPSEIGENNHFRDPKVWKHEDSWYMVVGTKKDGKGKVLLYRSANLLDWTYMSVLVESDGSMGHMYECPDLFPLGDADILLLSPEGMKDYPVSGYYVGKLNYETGEYQHGQFRLLDHGYHFYAPQTFLDHADRRLLIGWMPMKGSQLNKSWSGSMTFPRQLTLREDRSLLINPVSELEQLREDLFAAQHMKINNEERLLHRSTSLELCVTFDLQLSNAAQFGITLFGSPYERAMIGYEADTHSLFIDGSQIKASPHQRKYCKLGHTQMKKLHLQILLDRCTVEVFVNGGEFVLSTLLFPQADSRDLSLYAANGIAHIEQLDMYSLEHRS